MAARKPQPHCTHYSYQYLRCRCNACREGERQYQVTWKAKARAAGNDPSGKRLGQPDVRHGTRYSYDTLGCRCDDCRAANTERDRAKRARRKARELAAKG
jgi:hypothetical protein